MAEAGAEEETEEESSEEGVWSPEKLSATSVLSSLLSDMSGDEGGRVLRTFLLGPARRTGVLLAEAAGTWLISLGR